MFGEKLCKARTEKGLSQEQLAEKLFVTRQAVSRWENDKTQPDIQMLGRICAVLGVSSEYFINASVKNETSYKSLRFYEKQSLFWEFVKLHKKTYFINALFYFLSVICLCAILSLSIFTYVDAAFGTFGNVNFWAFLIAGVAVMFILFLSMALYASYTFSVKFNLWLAEKGIVRSRKFM